MAVLKLKRPVIGITGSAGKSTTKEMLASILATKWRVFKSPENKNIFRDTKRYAKQIRPIHKAVVLEYGMIYANRIKWHCSYIQPNIGIITMIGTSHIGNLGGLKGLIKAKSELIAYMNQNGMLFLNADDPNSKRLPISRFKGKIFRTGIRKTADYRATNINYSVNGMKFSVTLNGHKEQFIIPVLGRHNVYNALFAIAVAHRLGFNVKAIRKGLAGFSRLRQRLIVHKLPRRVTVIDDTFSSNPNAVKAAINVLSNVGKGRNVAVLGSMLELGRFTLAGHRKVGRYIAQKKVDYLDTYGNAALQIGVGAVKSKFPASRVKHFMIKNHLNRHLLGLAKPGTTILVKGSHDLRMGETVRYLRTHLSK